MCSLRRTFREVESEGSRREIPINPIQKLREQIVQMHKIFTKDFTYAKEDVK